MHLRPAIKRWIETAIALMLTGVAIAYRPCYAAMKHLEHRIRKRRPILVQLHEVPPTGDSPPMVRIRALASPLERRITFTKLAIELPDRQRPVIAPDCSGHDTFLPITYDRCPATAEAYLTKRAVAEAVTAMTRDRRRATLIAVCETGDGRVHRARPITVDLIEWMYP